MRAFEKAPKMALMTAPMRVLMMVARTGFEKVCSRVATTVGTRGSEKVLRKGDGL